VVAVPTAILIAAIVVAALFIAVLRQLRQGISEGWWQ